MPTTALDDKLNWNEHITIKCKKAKALIMMCKRAIGPTWGFKPETMRWVYRAMIRPVLLYAATIWIGALKTDKNLKQLRSVQRLSHIMTTGALPSNALATLDKITDTTPIDVKCREEAAQWCGWPYGQRLMGELTSHALHGTTIQSYKN